MSVLPACAVWWLIRIDIVRRLLGALLGALAFIGALVAYEAGLYTMGFFTPDCMKIDHFSETDGVDPGYEYVIESSLQSWWNFNPVYILKARYAPEVDGYKCLHRDIKCWPSRFRSQGLMEVGLGFRHIPNTVVLEITVQGPEDVLSGEAPRRLRDTVLEFQHSKASHKPPACDVVKGCPLVLDPYLARPDVEHLDSNHIEVHQLHCGLDGSVKLRAVISPPPPPRGNLAAWYFATWDKQKLREALEQRLKRVKAFTPKGGPSKNGPLDGRHDMHLIEFSMEVGGRAPDREATRRGCTITKALVVDAAKRQFLSKLKSRNQPLQHIREETST